MTCDYATICDRLARDATNAARRCMRRGWPLAAARHRLDATEWRAKAATARRGETRGVDWARRARAAFEARWQSAWSPSPGAPRARDF